MLAVKIYNEKSNRTEIFKKTIKNLIGHIYGKLSFKDVKVISDDDCIEIVSGNQKQVGEGQIVAELLIKKNIVINIEDFKDRAELDKFISQIKNFCDNAKSIEDSKYLDIDLRRT